MSDRNAPLQRIDLVKFQEFAYWIHQNISTKIRLFVDDIKEKEFEIIEKMNRMTDFKGEDNTIEKSTASHKIAEWLSLWESREPELNTCIQEMESQILFFTQVLCAVYESKDNRTKYLPELHKWIDRESERYSDIMDLELQIHDLADQLFSIFKDDLSESCKDLGMTIDMEGFMIKTPFNLYRSMKTIFSKETCINVISEVDTYRANVISTVTFKDIKIPDHIFMENRPEEDISLPSKSSSNTDLQTYLSDDEIDELKILLSNKLDFIIITSRYAIACYLSLMHGLYCLCKELLEIEINNRICA